MNVHRTFGQRLGAVLLSLILALTMMTTMIPSAVKAAPGTGTIYIGGMTGSVSYTWSGKAKKVQVVSSDYEADPEISYSQGGTDLGSAQPTDVGSYTVTAAYAAEGDLDAVTLTQDFEITKAANSWISVDLDGSKTYDGSAASVTAEPAFGEAKLVWKQGDTELTGAPSDVGTYTVTASVEGTSNYDEIASFDGTYTISKDANTISDLSMDDFVAGSTPAKPSATSKYDADAITYKYYSDASCTDEVTLSSDLAVGTYYVKATSTGTANYTSDTATTSFKVNAKSVKVPTVESKTYNGETQTADITDTDDYTVSENEGGMHAGTYDVELKLTDTKNSVWASGDEDGDGVIKIDFKILQADNAWTDDLAMQGWDYGDTASEPSATAKFGSDTIVYTYYDEDGNKLTEKPSKAGTYAVQASVAATDDYTALTSDKVSFDITKTGVAIPSLEDKAYTGKKQTSGIADSDDYEVVSDEGGTDSGAYTVEIALKDPVNMTWEDGSNENKTLTWNITKAENSWDAAPSIDSWTYGMTASTPRATPHFGSADDVVYTYYTKDSDDNYTALDEQPAEPGTYYLRASLKGTDNYEALESAYVEFRIKKQTIVVPSIGSTEYTGQLQTAAIPLSTFYTATANEGGTDVGTYPVELTLQDPDHFAWASGDVDGDGTISLAFQITKGANEFTQDLSMDDWTYGDEAKEPSASAKWGTPQYTYYAAEPLNEDNQLSGKPDHPGTYYVKATIPGTDNYDEISQSATFTINKIQVQVPTLEDLTYTGKPQHANIPASEQYYVTSDPDHTDAGTYTAEIALTDKVHCTWADGESKTTRTISYKILQAENTWVTPLTVESKVYDGEAPSVTAEAAFGDVTFSYFDDEKNRLDAAPTEPGTYYVTAQVEGTDNYTGLESATKKVVIAKKNVEVPSYEKEFTYNGEMQKPAIDETADYTVKNDGYVDAGNYNAELTLTDPDHTMWKDADADRDGTIQLPYQIKKAENEWTKELIMNGWVYGDEAKTPSAAAKFGDVVYTYYTEDKEALDAAPTEPGTYYVRAAVAGNESYNALSASEKFVIAKAAVEVPSYQDEFEYNGKVQKPALEETDDYSVTDSGHVDAGRYNAELTLKDPAHYQWKDTDADGDGTIKLAYRITKAENEWTKELTMDSWIYGTTAKKPSAAATYGEVTYTYYNSSKKALSAAPVVPGNYYVKATVKGTDSYNGLTSSFTSYSIKSPVLILTAKTRSTTTETLTWTKVNNADGYDLYYAKCGHTLKLIKSTTSRSYIKSSLKNNSEYKYKVRAYKMVNGKKVYVASSSIVHAVTSGSNSRYTDAKSIKMSSPAVTMTTGSTKKLIVKMTKYKSSKSYLPLTHNIYIRFVSSDTSVATVNASGTVSAKKAGKCTIYAMAANGCYAKTTITVR